MTDQQLNNLIRLRDDLDRMAKPFGDIDALRYVVAALMDVLIDGDSEHLRLSRQERPDVQTPRLDFVNNRGE